VIQKQELGIKEGKSGKEKVEIRSRRFDYRHPACSFSFAD
jgi:hypothetical protein